MKDMHRGFVINGKVAGDQSGRSVSSAGKAAMHIFHANTLLNPKCSFGISAGITMGINIISNIAFSSSNA
jgi:hypothetical protein